MTYKVIIQVPAEADAVEYVEYIIRQENDDERAKIWLRELEAQIFSLSEMPRRFPVIDEQSHFAIELRQFLHYSHRVIFHVDETKNEVHVLRIYHARRDKLQVGDITKV